MVECCCSYIPQEGEVVRFPLIRRSGELLALRPWAGLVNQCRVVKDGAKVKANGSKHRAMS